MPVWVVGARESAERDRTAIEGGIPSRTLMERAGTAAAAEITRRYSERLGEGAAVFTGPGNNGGDGWVVAGSLARDGVTVTVIESASPSPSRSPDAVAARDAAIGSVTTAATPPREPGVVIDALLGTGFEGEPRGAVAAAIAIINGLRGCGAKVAALDVPSGLDSTTGAHSQCVTADLTLSFGGLKRGTLLARDCCGVIVAIDIGLDDPSVRAESRGAAERLPSLVEGGWVRATVPRIHYDAHKGTRKHLAIVGSAPGMPGACVLAARGALRSGIGLVRIMAAKENLAAVLGAVPSALISEWPDSADQVDSEIGRWANAVVIGPGLGQSTSSRDLVHRVLRNSRVPTLLDADALNLFAGDAKSLGALLDGRPAIITPHPAEFGRLTGIDVKSVLANRFDVGLDVARELNASVLLKGSPTIVFTPSGERHVVARGSAALGTGGSGDLLDGIAGTMLAQLGDPAAAACCAAWVHGRAAELCGYVRGTTLEDVIYSLPRAWNEGEPDPEPPVLAELPAVA